MSEAAVENRDSSSLVTPGSTTAELRDVLVLTSPHCFIGQSPEDAWCSRARWHWTNSLFSGSWLKGDSLTHAAVRSNQGKNRENK